MDTLLLSFILSLAAWSQLPPVLAAAPPSVADTEPICDSNHKILGGVISGTIGGQTPKP